MSFLTKEKPFECNPLDFKPIKTSPFFTWFLSFFELFSKTPTQKPAGFCVGVLEKSSKKLKNQVKKGDVLIGLKSNGLHSNGFSLVRKLIEKKQIRLNQKFKGSTLGKALLKPTKIYVKDILFLKDKILSLIHI